MKLKELHEALFTERSYTDLNIEYGGRDLSLSFEKLTSLKGCPAIIHGDFYIYNNRMASLEYGPKEIAGNFHCENNRLTSLEGAPTNIGGKIMCSHNKLTSLQNIHEQIKSIGEYADFTYNPIKSHVLGLLLIDDLQWVNLDNPKVKKIINKHIANDRDVFECQQELMNEGFDEYAQL